MVTSLPAQLAVAVVLLPASLAQVTPAPATTVTAADTVVDAMYQGCFVDDESYTELRRGRRSRRDMDAEVCADVCNEYAYFGTANGEDCFCGDYAPTQRATNCNIPCSGNSMVACGGDDSMSVFMFKVLKPDTAVGATSRGCFEDTKRNRALDGPRESNRRHMDAEYCSDVCEGFPFFGTKSFKQCFCGEKPPTTAASDECDYPCAGKEEVACGGRRSINVYERKAAVVTPVTPTTPPTAAGPANDKAMGATLIGCFKDNPDADYVELRKARRNWERMTAERCANICDDFLYFGTENGEGCLCGDAALTEMATNCVTPCTGDDSVACGGPGSLSLFKFDDDLVPKLSINP